MYERRHTAPISIRGFGLRLAAHTGVVVVILAISLFAGMLGYRHYEHMSWLDAFVNAAMLLGGQGPIKTDLSDPGKLFAGLYALYAGLVFVASMSIIVAPVVHRVLHRLHWDDHGPE